MDALREVDEEYALDGSLSEGVSACVAVLLREVQYGSPTTDKLVSREVRPLVRGVVAAALRRRFTEDPDMLEALRSQDAGCGRPILRLERARARARARARRQRVIHALLHARRDRPDHPKG